MKNNIAGKVVVIVDAASRLGTAAAHRLSNEGAIVVLGGAEIERIRELAHELRWNGGKSIAVGVDAVDSAQLEGLLAAAVNAFGRVDVIVNNVAAAPAPDSPEGYIDRHLQRMLYGVSAALPYMRRQRIGQIINVPALPGDQRGSAAHGGTTRAVLALSEGLRKEFAQFNIRTTVISSEAPQAPAPGQEAPDGAADTTAADAGAAIRAESFARALAFVINQPDDLAVNEVQYRPMPQRA